MTNNIYMNVFQWNPDMFVYNQREIVTKLLDYFPNAHTEWKDLLQIEVQKIWDFVMSRPPEKRRMIMYDQIKHRHEREGPKYEVWIDFQNGLRIQGMCSIFAIYFRSPDEMPDNVVASLTDFIKSVTPEYCHDLLEISTIAWRFWDGKKLPDQT